MQGPKVRGKEGHVIKIKKPSPETADGTVKPGNGSSASPLNAPIVAGKRSNEGSVAAPRTVIQIPGSRGNKVSSGRHAGGEPGVTDDSRADDRNSAPPTHPVQKDPKPLLKLKFKNPYPDGHNAWASTEDEKGVIKGQRSKRKRPLPSGEKSSATADPRWYEDNSMDEMMDANWILQKLGKDAIGKRVEVHQQSDNTW